MEICGLSKVKQGINYKALKPMETEISKRHNLNIIELRSSPDPALDVEEPGVANLAVLATRMSWEDVLIGFLPGGGVFLGV